MAGMQDGKGICGEKWRENWRGEEGNRLVSPTVRTYIAFSSTDDAKNGVNRYFGSWRRGADWKSFVSVRVKKSHALGRLEMPSKE